MDPPFITRCTLAVALTHQSSKFILRTSTVLVVTTIIEVLNILQLPQRNSNKAEPVSLCCTIGSHIYLWLGYLDAINHGIWMESSESLWP